MQVTETRNEGLKRGYDITVTAAELNAKVAEKLAEAQPEVQMKGFRKGKVPIALLRKQFGQKLLGEAMQEAIDGAMKAHFETSGDRPAMQPDVKMTNADWKEGDDVLVSLSYERLPEVPEANFKSVTLEKLIVKPDDASVEEALQSLAKTAQTFEDREEAAKAGDGDQVVIDFVGKVDSKAFEGGSAEDYPLVLGSESFIPGFEAQLVGAKVGDEVAVTVNFPADYAADKLAGKEAAFDCKVKAVRAPKPATIDDELAKKFGADDLAGLKAQIIERLATEYASAARVVMKRKLLDALDELVSFALPEGLVAAEAEQIAHQLWHEEHPEDHEHDHPQIEVTDEHRKLGERRVRLGLLLAEIGRKNKIEVSDSEMSQAIMAQARQYPGQEREFFEFVQKDQQAQQQMRAPIFEDKVVDFIFELADVTDREVAKDELQKAVEALEVE